MITKSSVIECFKIASSLLREQGVASSILVIPTIKYKGLQQALWPFFCY